MVDYKIHAEALPEPVYDHPVVTRDGAVSAGVGSESTRDIPFGFNDLTTDLDFVNTYDKSDSSIEQTVIVDHHGNNPTGDNTCTLPEFAGQRVVIRTHAHGKPNSMFGGGEGADDYCKVNITLKVARRQKGNTVAFQKWGL